jgi:hypothetical protein
MAISVDSNSNTKDICFINLNYSSETIEIMGTLKNTNCFS